MTQFYSGENQFLARLVDYQERAIDTYSPVTTLFLNPQEIFQAKAYFATSEVPIYFYPEGHERQRAVISLYPPEPDWFEVSFLRVRYPKKFAKLKHSQILGSVLGTGIKRELLGDILTDGENWQLVVASHMVDFLKMSVKKVGAVSVTLEEDSQPLVGQSRHKDVELVVSSLRLDTLIATAFRLSRQTAKDLVLEGLVQRNWQVTNKAEESVALGDVISVRHHGRLELVADRGRTKNGKMKIALKVFENKK